MKASADAEAEALMITPLTPKPPSGFEGVPSGLIFEFSGSTFFWELRLRSAERTAHQQLEG